jgi:outer membrane protein assembly factor BamB
MISAETPLPLEFSPGEESDDGTIDAAAGTNCKWVAKLGSESYGTPTIAMGRVLVGTNNESPRDPKTTGDRGVVMSFDERTGAFQWQFTVAKLPGGDDVDWQYLGICSSALLQNDRGYVLTNRGEVAALHLKTGTPAWSYDMIARLGVVPHNITSSSAARLGNTIFASTSNGVDGEHEHTAAPDAPALIALDARSGRLLGKEASGISRRTFHCNWCSPAIGKVQGGDAVFFGGGDGFLYAFDPTPNADGILPELWRCDANPGEYRRTPDGEPITYGKFKGPSEIIGTPVFVDGKVYVTIGQDPESGDGVGMLSCINADTGKPVWTYKEISRSLSTPSVTKGLLYICDYSGRIHCLDAATGEKKWVHDSLSRIWGSTLVADGKIYIGTEDSELIILKEGPELKELGIVEFEAPIYSSPVAANRTLYVQTQTHLHAFATK